MSKESPGGSRLRRAGKWALVVVVILIGAMIVGIGPRLLGDARERDALAAFYAQPPDAADGAPGTIVRSEPLLGHPFDADAWRIMYRTTALGGETVAATGVVIVPHGQAPAGGRTVLAWGHPTTGTAPECAPSRSFDPFLDIEGMRLLLDRGYAIVAPDYVGMGTAGPDSYLIGATAGHTLLDGVRALRSIAAAEAGDDVVVWGHSQGGQAALFAAELAPQYAPEVDVKAVAVAAPAADLTSLLGDHLDDVSGATIGSYAFQAYAQAYADRGARLEQVLTPQAQSILAPMNELCLLSQTEELHRIAAPAVGDFFAADPADVAPWGELLQENSAGAVAFDAPLFVGQGLRDELVLPAATEAFVAHERSLGMDVTYRTVEHADHASIAYFSLLALSGWLNAHGL